MRCPAGSDGQSGQVIADGIQHVPDLRPGRVQAAGPGRRFRRHAPVRAGRRGLLPSCVPRFVDGPHFLEHMDRPASQRPDGSGSVFVISIVITPAETNPSVDKRSRGSDPRLLGLTVGRLLDRTFGERPRASRIVQTLS